MALQCAGCQRCPPWDTGVHRAAFKANNRPMHDIRCCVTLTWTRIGTYAIRQGIPVFMRCIAASMNH
jgi:hypothetical protein